MESENNVDAEKNSNGVVAVGQVGLQVFLWQTTERQLVVRGAGGKQMCIFWGTKHMWVSH